LTLQPLAAAGFGGGDQAERYERARPSYPPEAMALLERELRVGPGCKVLDLAAGTGKLTRALVATGASVVAVEPLVAMAGELARHLPSVGLAIGTAEAIPLAVSSIDVVTVAQAFHWFDAPRALAELARVLRPGGGLAIVWNEQDESVFWVAELSRLMHWDGQMPYDPDTDWAALVAASGAFTALEVASFRFDQLLDRELLCERVASSSYIAAMAPAEREEILARVRELVAGFPEPFALPYVCDVYWCRRTSG
jgi:SAM-dependent methyltransferase